MWSRSARVIMPNHTLRTHSEQSAALPVVGCCARRRIRCVLLDGYPRSWSKPKPRRRCLRQITHGPDHSTVGHPSLGTESAPSVSAKGEPPFFTSVLLGQIPVARPCGRQRCAPGAALASVAISSNASRMKGLADVASGRKRPVEPPPRTRTLDIPVARTYFLSCSCVSKTGGRATA